MCCSGSGAPHDGRLEHVSVGELNGVLFRMALAFTMDIGAPVSVGELNGVLFRMGRGVINPGKPGCQWVN